MLDPGSALPLYQQVKVLLRAAVEAGNWAVNAAIPPERELIQRYGVSRITVRQALADLVSEGLLYRQHGKGTFVAPRRPGVLAAGLSELIGHVEELQLRGLAPRVQVLHLQQEPLADEVSRALGRTAGTTGWRILRLIRVDDLPLMVAETFVPADLGMTFALNELTTTAVARLLEMSGHFPITATQSISAGGAQADEASLLGIRLGEPVLVVTRVVFGRDEIPLEWSRAVYRADRYRYDIELRRSRRG